MSFFIRKNHVAAHVIKAEELRKEQERDENGRFASGTSSSDKASAHEGLAVHHNYASDYADQKAGKGGSGAAKQMRASNAHAEAAAAHEAAAAAHRSGNGGDNASIKSFEASDKANKISNVTTSREQESAAKFMKK